jgi:UDP-N-acetylmuramate: L-alanyl-gamma-D-glutamyl-meso-diaminopimelate ligase
LENSGVNFFKGYRKENIPPHVDMFVVGKHAKLVPEENEEVRTAFATGLPVKSFAEVLGSATQGKENIIVAGSYGKSTCAALLAWCLESAGKKPGYFIGAVPRTPPKSSTTGRGNLFVLEGDEYPSSNWDGRSKFLHYHPSHLLLTSLAHDHLNIFKTAADYRLPFKNLINSLPAEGMVVACSNGNHVKETLRELGRKAVFYGLDGQDAEWSIKDARYGEISSFNITRGSKKIARISTKLLGRHNMENMLGVSALLLTLELVTTGQLVQAISRFEPLERRLSRISDRTLIPLYEGFGSSRDKAKAAIGAIKLHYPEYKLIVIFEPHTFSWRNRDALSWYKTVFTGADKVFIYKPPTGALQENQLTLAEILDAVGGSVNAAGFESAKEGVELISRFVNKKSAVLILSSGGFDGIIGNVARLLEEKFPKL